MASEAVEIVCYACGGSGQEAFGLEFSHTEPLLRGGRVVARVIHMKPRSCYPCRGTGRVVATRA